MEHDAIPSGSSSISSPPGSPQFPDTIHVARNLSNSALPASVAPAHSASSAQHPDPRLGPSTSSHTNSTNTSLLSSGNVSAADAGNSVAANGSASNPAVAPKPKRAYKKREIGPDGKPIDNKPKAPRKPRVPKEKPAAGTTTAATARKKKNDGAAAAVQSSAAPPPATSSTVAREPTITDIVNALPAPAPPAASSIKSTATSAPARSSQPPPSTSVVESAARPFAFPPPSKQSSPSRPPIQSYEVNRKYDPVRGMFVSASSPTSTPIMAAAAPTKTSAPLSSQGPTNVNKASASASIAGLIDPPAVPNPSIRPPPQSHPFTSTADRQLPIKSQPQSPTHLRITPAASAIPSSTASPQMDQQGTAAQLSTDSRMEVDRCDPPVKPKAGPKAASKATLQAEVKPSAKSSASATTPPKVARPIQATKGTGSGLLSSSSLFGIGAKDDTAERHGVNIDIEIPLNPLGGNTINIAQEIMKKYGRDAINPRAAAHRARLLEVAAAASKFDGGDGDDMSIDLMSELNGDSNVEMGGMDEEKSAAENTDSKPKKRKRKDMEYDKEDDFIDDTELAWQEQAAVAKDGFFVYSGPLIPAGEVAQVESSVAGRGRGRARGGRARGAASGTSRATTTEKKEASAAATAPRGRATKAARGTTTVRKPRITKADQKTLEAEKLDRERAGANMSGPAGSAVSLMPTPSATSSAVYQAPTASQPIMSTTA